MGGSDEWYLDRLACPRDQLPLSEDGGDLVCASGHRYPVVDGIPVMLMEEVSQTIPLAEASLRRAKDPGAADRRAPDLYLETLGIVDAEKQGIVALAASKSAQVDPVVSFLVGATSGSMYAELIGKLESYPIPEIRLPPGDGKRLLDVGCSWGRWSIAATRKGYDVVGIDPSLGAVMAARRTALALGVHPKFLVADARHLPFAKAAFDVVFSYSVLQHFSRDNMLAALHEAARVLAPCGTSLIQMASAYGVRSLYHRLRRRARPPGVFDVRYWRPAELRKMFGQAIGSTTLSADCYFGLGLQGADAGMMGPSKRLLLRLSERLARLSLRVPVLVNVADSIYVTSVACAE
ncbi:MAG TPA: methyltransferase domain-containing protein [Burkholderiales bacterium]|nr:methyltransferase domain-containing protein [Burkholderiales bacterium]